MAEIERDIELAGEKAANKRTQHAGNQITDETAAADKNTCKKSGVFQ